MPESKPDTICQYILKLANVWDHASEPYIGGHCLRTVNNNANVLEVFMFAYFVIAFNIFANSGLPLLENNIIWRSVLLADPEVLSNCYVVVAYSVIDD